MFLVFEGGEACGKTTQIRLLEEHFKKKGRQVLVTREPGGTPFAEQLRSLFKAKSPEIDEPLPLTELYVVMAARYQHIQKQILPSLSAGLVVLCDRFFDSSLVYQGHLGGIPLATLCRIAESGLCDLIPDLSFTLDVPVDVALDRIQKRKNQSASDRYDQAPREGLEQLRQGFLNLVAERTAYPNGKIPERVLIAAAGDVESTHTKVLEELNRHAPTSKFKEHR